MDARMSAKHVAIEVDDTTESANLSATGAMWRIASIFLRHGLGPEGVNQKPRKSVSDRGWIGGCFGE